MSEQLQMSLLGVPEIRRDGQPITGFTHRKSLALLCYLAVSGKPHSRASLAGLLWGDSTEANARGGLRKSLAELRKLVGPNLLITRHDVAFNRNSTYWLDVALFDQEATTFKQIHREGLTPAQAAPLIEADVLYRGEFMAGFHVLRAQAFEEWILLERERLRLSALRMTYALAVHFLTQADYKQAINYAERVLSLEPCHEESHRLLMSLLALSGQQSAALRQYQLCCDSLANDLRLEPSSETTTLYERIRDGESNAALTHQVEKPVLPLIGRKHELASIMKQLMNPRCRLLTLLGPGGVGKTHIAQEIAATYDLKTAENSAVYLIPLGSSPSVGSLVPALAHGVGFYFSQESLLRKQLLSFLQQQNALLILDSCEGLLDFYEAEQGSFVDLLDDILRVAPGVKILITSRTRLNLPAESVFPVTGMSYPDQAAEMDGNLTEFDAVQLFLWRMRRIEPDVELGPSGLTAVAKICRFARGMPLEILLIANWAQLLDPPTILEHLTGENGPVGDSPIKRDLQRNLAPVFDQSWDLLNSIEQRRLVTLSIFRDGFTFQSVNQILDLSHRDLMALVDQSIVNQIDLPFRKRSEGHQSARFDMHDLLCDYVLSRPEMGPFIEDAREIHGQYFIAALQNWGKALLDGRERETILVMDVEMTNVRTAWEWAAGACRTTLLADGLDGLCRYYRRRFRYVEGRTVCETAVQALIQAGSTGRRIQAKAISWQSFFTPNTEQAFALLDESFALLKEIEEDEDVRSEKALALYFLGTRLLNSDHRLAKKRLEESLSLYRQLDEDWYIAQTLHQLFIQSWKSGSYDEGKRISLESLSLYEAAGDKKGYAGVLGDLGIGQLQAGLIEEGLQSIQESTDIFEQLGDRAAQAKGHYYSGMALAFSGKFTEAEEQLKKCLPDSESYSTFYDTVLITLSLVKSHLGFYEEAGMFASRGLQHAREIDNQMCIGRGLSALALALVGEGESLQAAKYAQEAVEVYRRFNMKTEQGLAVAACGFAACQNDEIDEANGYFTEALKLSLDQKDQFSLLYAFLGMIYLFTFLGQTELAIERYAAAVKFPIVANSNWFYDVIKTRIDKMAESLPEEDVKTAVARGQEQDLTIFL